jgi:hypothetical protein
MRSASVILNPFNVKTRYLAQKHSCIQLYSDLTVSVKRAFFCQISQIYAKYILLVKHINRKLPRIYKKRRRLFIIA